MKFQFTTEGSKSQTMYHYVRIVNADDEDLFKCIVSTPLGHDMLQEFLNSKMEKTGHCLEAKVGCSFDKGWAEGERSRNSIDIIGLDNIARIISNIKPLKQKVVITICGERKTYEVDPDKFETLLKSLE